MHRVGIAAVFAADPDLQIGPGRPAQLGTDCAFAGAGKRRPSAVQSMTRMSVKWWGRESERWSSVSDIGYRPSLHNFEFRAARSATTRALASFDSASGENGCLAWRYFESCRLVVRTSRRISWSNFAVS